MAQSTQEQLVTKIKENYQSIILGALVLLVGISTLLRVSGNKQATQKAANEKKEVAIVTQNGKAMAKTAPSMNRYVVKKGDTLWKIAENNYDSGYAWGEVAKANKLKHANSVEVGQSLELPKIAAKLPATKGQLVRTTPKTRTMMQTKKVTIQGARYTVVKGDNLWTISVRAYGDGYQWPKVAKANKLKNPNLIHSGNVLRLPR